MDEETGRFDIEKIDYDKDGVPIFPRISFSIPRAYRAQFLQMMIDEVRNMPGEQLMAIFVKFMRSTQAENAAAAILGTTEGERRRIPSYGPKSSTYKAAPAAELKQDGA